MFLPKLPNLRALVFQHLLATENRSATTLEPLGKGYGSASSIGAFPPIGQSEQPLWRSRGEQSMLAPYRPSLAELDTDWTAPKLALRAEVELATAERRAARVL